MSNTNTTTTTTTTTTATSAQDLHGARRGLLKAIWQHTLAPRFQSKPMDLEGYFSERGGGSGSFYSSAGMSSSIVADAATAGVGSSMCDNGGDNASTTSNTLVEESSTSPNLTASETAYLEGLLKSDDLESIRRASIRLADKEIFPTAADGGFVNDDDEDMVGGDNNSSKDDQAHHQDRSGSSLASGSTSRKSLQRRDSQVQQQLFELHEKTTIMPSVALRRMSGAGTNGNPGAAASNRRKARFQSKPILPDGEDDDDDGSLLAVDGSVGGATRLRLNNSLTQDDESAVFAHASVVALEEEKSAKDQQTTQQSLDSTTLTGTIPDQEDDNDPMEREVRQWNPLKDLNAWIDGSEGFEVDDEGHAEISSPTSNPFKILGTSADDISCHPHVLSPPLMEGLQLFMPESLQEQHYWLKYSLVRDGPGLLTMLRHCRASPHTVLAIETTDGHVFGSFTSQPWRLKTSSGYYGSKESFVWRMRRSRNEPCKSVIEQILMESKIDVFPFTSRNNQVQMCTVDGIALGHGEVKDEEEMKEADAGENSSAETKPSEDSNQPSTSAIDASTSSLHYGSAIRLNKSLNDGSTSSSETFGNPCLIHRVKRGETFVVANVELWSLTPHETVEEADMAEMKTLFLEEERHNDSNLNLIEILVGGTTIA